MPIFIEGQIIKLIIIHYSKKKPLRRLGSPACIDVYPVRMIWTYMSGSYDRLIRESIFSDVTSS